MSIFQTEAHRKRFDQLRNEMTEHGIQLHPATIYLLSYHENTEIWEWFVNHEDMDIVEWGYENISFEDTNFMIICAHLEYRVNTSIASHQWNTLTEEAFVTALMALRLRFTQNQGHLSNLLVNDEEDIKELFLRKS